MLSDILSRKRGTLCTRRKRHKVVSFTGEQPARGITTLDSMLGGDDLVLHQDLWLERLDPTSLPKLILGTLPKGGCDNFLLQESITNKMSHLTQACPQMQAKYLQQQEGPPVPGLYPTCFTFNRNMLCLLQTLTNPFWVCDKLVIANPTVLDD